MPSDRRSRLRLGLFGLYVVICLAMICWPGYETFGGRIEPYVFGLPFSLAWVVGWVLAAFVVLTAFHLTAREDSGGKS